MSSSGSSGCYIEISAKLGGLGSSCGRWRARLYCTYVRWRHASSRPGQRHDRGCGPAPAGPAFLVRARDRSRVSPTCRTPAERCDIDHLTAWGEGGTTSLDNLVTLCEAHHRLKHAPGRTLTRDEASGVLSAHPRQSRLPAPPRRHHHPAAPPALCPQRRCTSGLEQADQPGDPRPTRHRPRQPAPSPPPAPKPATTATEASGYSHRPTAPATARRR